MVSSIFFNRTSSRKEVQASQSSTGSSPTTLVCDTVDCDTNSPNEAVERNHPICGYFYGPRQPEEEPQEGGDNMAPNELQQEILAMSDKLNQILEIVEGSRQKRDSLERSEKTNHQTSYGFSWRGYASKLRQKFGKSRGHDTHRPEMLDHDGKFGDSTAVISRYDGVYFGRISEMPSDGVVELNPSPMSRQPWAATPRQGAVESSATGSLTNEPEIGRTTSNILFPTFPPISELEVPLAELYSPPPVSSTPQSETGRDYFIAGNEVRSQASVRAQEPVPIAELSGGDPGFTMGLIPYERPYGPDKKATVEDEQEPTSLTDDLSASVVLNTISAATEREEIREYTHASEGSVNGRFSFLSNSFDDISLRKMKTVVSATPERHECGSLSLDVDQRPDLQRLGHAETLEDDATVRNSISAIPNSGRDCHSQALEETVCHEGFGAAASMQDTGMGIDPWALDYRPNPVHFPHLQPIQSVANLSEDDGIQRFYIDTAQTSSPTSFVDSGISVSPMSDFLHTPETGGVRKSPLLQQPPASLSTNQNPLYPEQPTSSYLKSKGCPNSLTCSVCGESFERIGLTNKHFFRKHVRRFVCKRQNCEAAFSLKHDLDRHERDRHDIPGMTWRCTNLNCQTPQKVWTRKDNFNRHVKTCISGSQRSVRRG